MPSIVKIRIVEARHLPVMDRATGSTDGFVIVRFAGREDQTNVQRKTLTPHWDEDFRFDVQDDAALQNEPLVLRVMDSDSFGASNPIGTCHVSLTPLLAKDTQMSEELSHRTFTSGLSGWFPIFDTLEGIRGELYVIVKVQNVADENPYSESSTIVELFSSSWLDPEVIAVERVMGFVEELVVDEDPEYSWSNNFHSARLTNDARLQLMYKLSMAVRRLVGKKALELGANAVVGYQQHFDIEGNSGMVCRGYGTACIISKTRKRRRRRQHVTGGNLDDPPAHLTVMGSRTLPVFSDGTATSSLHRADETVYGVVPHPFLLDPPRASPQQQYLNSTFSSTEATILTMNSFPVNLRLQLGGLVVARSVKFLGRLNAFKADRETRDQWWAELRAEVKSHAAALLCNYVVGYSETCTIYDDVCVLSATGTAAVLKESKPVWKIEREEDEEDSESPTETNGANASEPGTGIVKNQEGSPKGETDSEFPTSGITQANNTTGESSESRVDAQGSVVSEDAAIDSEPDRKLTGTTTKERSPRLSVVLLDEEDATMLATHGWSRKKRRREIRRQKRRVLRATLPCYSMHVPFVQNAAPFANMRLVPCGLCKTKWVPELMLSTTEPPPMLPVTGGGTIVEARVCKTRDKADTRENDAGALGEQLVFLEIELHRQLMLKLKVMGMNAAFSLRAQINFSGDLLVGVISATAIHTPVLPPPAVLRIKRNIAVVDTEDRMLMDLQRRIESLAGENRARLLKIAVAEAESARVALSVAKAKKSRALDEESEALKWRKVGESVANDAALVANERLKAAEAGHATLLTDATITAEARDKAAAVALNTSNNSGGGTPQGLQSQTASKAATGWFARRRRNQETAEINESMRWQTRRGLRANLGLGTMSKAINTSLHPGGAAAASKSPQLGFAVGQVAGDEHAHGLLPPMALTDVGAPSGTSSPVLSEPPLGSPKNLGDDEIMASKEDEHKRRHHHHHHHMQNKSSQLIDPSLFRNSTNTLSSSSSSSSSSTSSGSSSSSSDDDSTTSSEEDEMDEEEAETLLNELRGDKNCFVVEIDDETDEDIMAVLFDRQTPPDVALCTSNTLPQFTRKHQVADSGTFVSAVRTYSLDRGRSTRLNLQVAALFHQTYALMALKLARYTPCVVAGLRVQISVPSDDTLVLTLTATVSRLRSRTVNGQSESGTTSDLRDVPLGLPPLLSSVFNAPIDNSPGLLPIVDQGPAMGLPNRSPTGVGPLLALKKHIWGVSNGLFSKIPQMIRQVSRSSSALSVSEANGGGGGGALTIGARGDDLSRPVSTPTTIAGLLGIPAVPAEPPTDDVNAQSVRLSLNLGAISTQAVSNATSSEDDAPSTRNSSFRLMRSPGLELGQLAPLGVFRPNVVLTALEYIPGARVTRYLGRINIHLIKESAVVRESGGLSAFYYPFMLQAHAIARAHVEALGGNALLSFRLVRRDSVGQKNQTYNLISLSGDAVLATFIPGSVSKNPLPVAASMTLSGSPLEDARTVVMQEALGGPATIAIVPEQQS